MTTSRQFLDPGLIQRIPDAVTACLPAAAHIFDELERTSADGEGITRAAFGPGEQAACELIAGAAGELELELAQDPAGNLYATLPGKDRSAPAVVIGSHLDSVPKGGNYDGAAGVVAGLTAVSALRRLGLSPTQDIRVMGIRGEESPWFGTAYLGSRLALGLLPPERLDDLKRFDSGRTLAEHIADLGYDVSELRKGTPHLTPSNVAEYYELHIEQGPLLEAKGLAVAVATSIRGNARYPFARCVGAYAHSAAVPRAFRSDAVLATAELVTRLDAFWQEIEAAGSPDSVFTVGKFFTDPDLHAMTKVPGTVSFTLNFGTTRPSDIETFKSRVGEITRDIEARRRVRFELGEAVGTDPLALDSTLRLDLADACDALGHTVFEMATVGHDAAMFTSAGIPSGMILVRNAHGSHNADESMDLDDFAEGCRILVAVLAKRGCHR